MKNRTTRLLLCLAFILALPQATITLHAQTTVPDNTEGRLWRLGKVWGYLKYYHPKVCTLNWDSLLYNNIPLVMTATSNADFNNRLQTMLEYAGQISPAEASAPPATDSNLNLDLAWTTDPTFSLPVQQFLDTFKSRAGSNDALSCRITLLFGRSLSFEDDMLTIPIDYSLETDRLTVFIYYWNVVRYFFPYHHLTNTPWDSTLLQVMPDVRLATNDSSFLFAIAKAQSRINDSHGFITGFNRQFLGAYLPGILTKKIGADFVVTKVRDSSSGIRPGDRVLKINSNPVNVLAESYRDVMAASNDPAYYRTMNRNWLRGAENTVVSLEFSNAANQVYTRDLVRDMRDTIWTDWWYKASDKAWKVLCNDYGYIDIGKMMDAEASMMYADLKDKPGIVIDARRYPVGYDYFDLFLPAPVHAANYFVPNIKAPGWFRLKDDTDWPVWNNPNPYPGKLFLLVNEETQSSGEYFVQYMSRVPGSKVVGSQTAGADGNVAMFSLPNSDLIYNFTDLGWYYYDWYQCQRNGLRIDEIVHPTIAGIRAGRDEVLEYVTGCNTGLATASSGLADIRLYPNPATGELNIDLSLERKDRLSFRVTDIPGRPCLVYDAGQQRTLQNKHRISVATLKPGMYFLQVVTGSGAVKTMKFSKR